VEKQLKNKDETIDALKRENKVFELLVQSKDREINMLQKYSDKYSIIEQENIELKRKIEEYQRYSQEPQSLMYNSYSRENTTIRNNVEIGSHGGTPSGDMGDIIIKIETDPGEDSSKSCQISNKRRKVVPGSI
jgi:hypothetical protein